MRETALTKLNKFTIYIIYPSIPHNRSIYIGRRIIIACAILYTSSSYSFNRILKYSISCKGNSDGIGAFIVKPIQSFSHPQAFFFAKDKGVFYLKEAVKRNSKVASSIISKHFNK